MAPPASTPHSELRQRIAMGIPRRNPVWTSPAFPSWEQVDDARDALDKLVEQYEDAQATIRQRDAQIQELTRDGGGDSIHLRIASEARERMHAAEDEAASLKEQYESATQQSQTFYDRLQEQYAKVERLEEQNESLRAGLDELLSAAERIRGGDSKLNPEEWYAARDYARATLARYPAKELCDKEGCNHPATYYDAWGMWCFAHNGGREPDPASEPEAT